MKQALIKLISTHTKFKKREIEKLIEIPPNPELGDYAFPCFILAKKLKKNPAQIALRLAEKIKPTKEIQEIKAAGAYLNFFINKNLLAEQTISQILKEKDRYGNSKKTKEKIMVEFSQANTHKAFHVGHIRGTSLGESLSRILEATGNKVIRANYQGDTGMHVAKWIWCYKKYHLKEKLKRDESWIAGIYVDAIQRLAKNPKLQEEVDQVNLKLEQGKDKKLRKLWKQTRKLSLDALEKIYKELNTFFDIYFFESQVEKQAKEIALELEKKKIAKKSQGAIIVDLEKYNLGIWVLLRKDGTVLYSAKDIALAEKKFNQYKIDRAVYVVGSEQKLHFYQLFKTLELMKFKQAKKCEYVPVSLVRLPHSKMSSRTGDNILYSDFIKEVIDYSKKELKKRDSKISESEIKTRSLAIAIAAVKYAMLKQDPNKMITFVKEEALNFEGNSGPYLQYTYARASSILRKAKKKPGKIKITSLENIEKKLVTKLTNFPQIVLDSASHYNPSLIANYSFELAQIFNEFYHCCKVIGEKQEATRLALVQATRQTIKNTLSLLGIDVLEEM